MPESSAILLGRFTFGGYVLRHFGFMFLSRAGCSGGKVLLHVILFVACHRQLDSEGVNSTAALYPNLSPVCFYDTFRNGETQPIATCSLPCSIGSIETLVS